MPHYLLALGYEETRDLSLNTPCDALLVADVQKLTKAFLNLIHYTLFLGGGILLQPSELKADNMLKYYTDTSIRPQNGIQNDCGC